MRKSHKKVKSERINALRKKYDAFLEEDKLRKDRNGFILEKLDKMCFNSAVVPIQNTRNVYSNRQLEVCNQTERRIENVPNYSTQISRHIAPEFPKNITDESFMIQEISKKYILIPKINTTSLSNHTPGIKSSTDDNSDWMHKYEILNRLQKNDLYAEDKIHDDDNYFPGVTSKSDKLQNINSTIMDIPEKDNIQKEDISGKMKTETTNEGTTKGLLNFEYKETFDEVNNIPVLASSDQNEPNSQNVNKSEYEINTRIVNNVNTPSSAISHLESKYDNSKNFIQNEMEVYTDSKNGYIDTDSENMSSNEPITLSEKRIPAQDNTFNNIENEKDYVNSTRDLNDSVKEIIKDTYDENLQGGHDAKYSEEIINDQTIKLKNNIKLQKNVNISSEEKIKHQTVDVENNSEHLTSQEFNDSIPEHEIQAEDVVKNSDIADITSGIEAFDAEQREMFYSDQAQENYEYEQSDITATYDQTYDANNENDQQNMGTYDQTYDAINKNDHQNTVTYDQTYDAINENDHQNTDTYDQTYDVTNESDQQNTGTYDQTYDTNNQNDQQNTGTYDQNYDANNENYQQNTEYYEGVQTEQAYPDEINEHEETLQHYDQNYGEQYSTYEQEKYEQQEYEDPHQNEQLPEQIQPQINDKVQSEVGQLEYEQHNYEAQAYVEEQLDREHGLTENEMTNEVTVENLHIEEKQAEQVVD